jgi:membrane-bound lytic murein transglycosylase A
MIHSISAPSRLARSCAALASLLVAACAAPPAPPTGAPALFAPATFADLPGYATDRVSEAWPALLVGCRKLVSSAATEAIWRAACAAAERVDGADESAVRAYLAAHFSPYRITTADGGDSGLVTGYYEPRLAGSRTATTTFRVPLYAPPDDLLTVDLAAQFPELSGKRVRGRVDGKRVVPYWSRDEIDAGKPALDGKALAYVANPLDAFFLQIQGSGRIGLPGGDTLRVGYADQNGHPYVAIGRVLVERGELALEGSSMQAIRAWAQRNPERLPALLRENPSYVFFRELPAPPPGSLEAAIDGPLGSLGVPLLAQRSVAIDARAVPLGAPMWLATRAPTSQAPLERLVLAQDTGGAIRGAIRADFFWGSGDAAGAEAGRMREPGRLWLLWPKAAPPPGQKR